MSKQRTIEQPIYSVKGKNGENISAHHNKQDAYVNAITLAFEYPDCTFIVVKKANWQEEQLFSFKIDMRLDFSEIKDIFVALLGVIQNKYKKTDFWKSS